MKISSIIFSTVVIFTAIACVESTWLLNRRCNGTVEPWGTYLTGDCQSLWGSTGYGSCSGSEYTNYNCRGSPTCSSCKVDTVQQMDECSKQNVYATCSSGTPDYSAFGSSYATLQIYLQDNCVGSPAAILASPINKCLNSAVVSASDPYKSIYVACSKDGSATLNLYHDLDCQTMVEAINFDISGSTCSVNPFVRLPSIATCTGY